MRRISPPLLEGQAFRHRQNEALQGGVFLLHPDQHHDVEHHTTIDRRTLTFEENAMQKGGGRGALMMDGRCRLVAAG